MNILLSADNILRKTDAAGNVIKEELSTTAMTIGERAIYCLQRTLIGLGIVFGVLVVIMIVLYISKFIFTRGESTSKHEENKKPEETPAAEPISAPVASDDGAIVAAIVAAITAMRENENDPSGFRVVSFKRAIKTRPWNQNK